MVVVGPEATVEDLVRYHNNGRLMGREECTVDEWIRQVAVEVAEELGLLIPEVFTCVPLNSPGVIFQYRIMLKVMGLLTLQQHEEFLFQFSSEQWPDPVGCSVPIVVKVRVDEVGGRDVAIQDEMEADVSSAVLLLMEVQTRK
ncbi:hypothetical protein DPMN_148815 [Dreissena polymorpha]|uniref:Uncharacterized protein n=1 Tax=Dreissena polymorpha TaxID=45954 RepID=A0A9D4FET7_DREPO|nr:hypothetical protein DPMN_148815 [Dreissena polymorpha]